MDSQEWDDDVLRLEKELRGALARVAELEAAAKPISLSDAPRDGSPVIVETRTGQVLLVHWQLGSGQWVSQGAAITDISLTNLCRPISPWQAGEDGEN